MKMITRGLTKYDAIEEIELELKKEDMAYTTPDSLYDSPV